MRISDWSSDVCSSDLLGQIIYIARAERNQIIAAPLMVGSTLHSHCTSMGRVLLAAADAVERETWLEQAVLERRTDRTIVDASALRDEIGAVGQQRWSLVEAVLKTGLRSQSGRASGWERVGQ